MSLLKLATEPLQVITKELAIWELAALICTCEEAKRILKTTASVLQAKMPGCISMERPNKLIQPFDFYLRFPLAVEVLFLTYALATSYIYHQL